MCATSRDSKEEDKEIQETADSSYLFKFGSERVCTNESQAEEMAKRGQQPKIGTEAWNVLAKLMAEKQELMRSMVGRA